jgi:multidrug resistance efflux pump
MNTEELRAEYWRLDRKLKSEEANLRKAEREWERKRPGTPGEKAWKVKVDEAFDVVRAMEIVKWDVWRKLEALKNS